MKYQGVLKKMKTENSSQIQYYLDMNSDFLNMNQLLDKEIVISFVTYECLNCHLEKKVFRQGYCKSCFFEIPNAADWIMKPELSKAHLNIEDRDLAYEKSVQLKPHIVYLANSSNVKVGVTRKQQVPTRWIDQGAHEALEIVEVPNRYLAGITEVALKEYVADKTNWRKMLKNDIEDENLVEWRDKLKVFIPEEAKEYFIENNSETHLSFPVLKYPEKPKSLNLIKTPTFKGKLVGIKGQYLIFEDETVFNVRSNEGLVVSIEI
ncbi:MULTISPECIES: DUF2797 domain-containing protein [unclassified Polaribacter]|jgi:hypothetical protein|uniref:DUF2797 domain-containing protein n=1 Tax=unclassified Polaribacter TaxID=196858 RepID=UPI00052DF06C|nr:MULTISPECIES: DUF2797 domain-containing protein [unclassified Polaribacter]KGL59824.1 hypothetical protein PHEL49_0687 [Polaribacter sp. Hel1_33_49]MBT3742949.1 DUF2797 domain-containing protein [Polaribacter sp.]MBT7816435.1 DUF2797 domain-containing protein [Polaribacter sp.]MDG1195518.1 DUF2797 domain-containing protein [Polaribacter sp.]MDG1404061.1 DUF2797 domain-containing protein [Polaribacter sp.]